MSEEKVCIVCGKWFVARSPLHTACSKPCAKERTSRYKRQWQKKNWTHRKEYMKQYQFDHKDELRRKSYIRVKEWRRKHKRRYFAQHHEKRYDGMWLKTMDKHGWGCGTCDNEAQLVHHKDQDATNNVEINLIALCRGCHCKIHKPHEFHKT